jgi:AraC-like DNA-binding protein
MSPASHRDGTISALWQIARAGDLRRATDVARAALAERSASPAERVELLLVCASCAMRQGEHADALRDLDAAAATARSPEAGAAAVLRVDVWRAELAYFQGRYSDASGIVDRTLPKLECGGDLAYAALALRVRIAILLARTDYAGVAAIADHAMDVARSSGDDYALMQILNVLGAVQFDRATSKLQGPHAHSHLSALDPRDAVPMEKDAREALRHFENARAVAERAGYEFAAWYVAGNIERLEILLGHADRAVRAIRKRLGVLQARGAKYDEIVTRSNLGWGLRTLGRHREALHELDVALELARATGTFNVLLEFLEYDRSIVLDALGDPVAARASYRRYLQLAGRCSRTEAAAERVPAGTRRALEPYFMKRADRFIVEHFGRPLKVSQIAAHCGVSWRTLEAAFRKYRGITPVTHARNMRLDGAHRALNGGCEAVSDVAARFGFGSVTTFALEYRKRFGKAPSHNRRAGR